MGEGAAKKRGEILRGIGENRLMPNTYVITLPESGNHLLDIRPVLLLTKEEREGQDPLILGVALGMGEAGELVRRMVEDMYTKTGSFDWNEYMRYLG